MATRWRARARVNRRQNGESLLELSGVSPFRPSIRRSTSLSTRDQNVGAGGSTGWCSTWNQASGHSGPRYNRALKQTERSAESLWSSSANAVRVSGRAVLVESGSALTRLSPGLRSRTCSRFWIELFVRFLQSGGRPSVSYWLESSLTRLIDRCR